MNLKIAAFAATYLVLVIILAALVLPEMIWTQRQLYGTPPMSDAYWRGEARPFAVLEFNETDSMIGMEIQNVENANITLEKILILPYKGTAHDFVLPGMEKPFYPGEKRSFRIEKPGDFPKDGKCMYMPNFTYSSVNLETGITQNHSILEGKREFSYFCRGKQKEKDAQNKLFLEAAIVALLALLTIAAVAYRFYKPKK